jgi:DNA-binding GntR family transcriptional regulator
MAAGQKTGLDRERAYHEIRALVLDGALDSNEAISERKLSERFGIGRTPVREALHLLTAEGLLHVVPMQGTFVRSMSFDDLREIYEMRIALEGMAAFLAAVHGATADMIECARKLRLLHGQEAHDEDLSQQLGWRFHDELFIASRNSRLIAAYDALRAQSGLALRKLRSYGVRRAPHSTAEHLAIFDAVESGNPSLARERMLAHLSNAFQARIQVLGFPLMPTEEASKLGGQH